MKNRIKQFLQERNITAYQFRKEVGIAQRTAYDLYNNPDQLPSSTVLSKICDTYQVQPGEVLEWIPKSGKSDSENELPKKSVDSDSQQQDDSTEQKANPKSYTQLSPQEEAA